MTASQGLPATARPSRAAATVDLRARVRAAREEAEQCMAQARRALNRSAELRVSTTRTPTTAGTSADLRASLRRSEERAEHLQRALATNRRIGMAIGIVMRELRCTEEQAFHALQQASMQSNVKLRHLAERVIHTGTL